MEISSRFVGAPLKPMETQITWRQTTNYAAALGDTNPRYLDDERPEGIVASPMFCVAVTWPISERRTSLARMSALRKRCHLIQTTKMPMRFTPLRACLYCLINRREAIF